MRPSRTKWKLAAACATVPLATAALLASVIPASASAQHPAKNQGAKVAAAGNCVTLNLVEITVKVYTNMKPPSGPLPAGFMGAYFDKLYNSSDTTQLGNSVGHLDIMYQLPNGDPIEYLSGTYQLPEGTFLMTGPFNRTFMLGGNWIVSAVKGTSGQYLGLHGSMRWRVTSFTAPGLPVQEQITLCG